MEKTRILVIDDEEMLRELMCIMLASNGYTVTACKNGKEGIQYFRSGNYDIILTDLKMPEMSGFEVAEAIRQLDLDVPIALVTANAPSLSSMEVKRFGIDILLAKPFTLKQLTNLVTSAMELKKMREIAYPAVA